VGGALAVELRGEHALLAGLHVGHEELRVRGHDLGVLGERGDLPAVRAERGQAVGQAVIGEHPTITVGRGDVEQVDVADVVEVPVLGPRGGHREPRTVRRPRGPAVLVRAACDEKRCGGPVRRHHEDAARAVDDPACAVEAGEQPVDASRRPSALVVAVRIAVAALPGREGDARAVRGPHRLLDGLRALADGERLARDADGRHVQRVDAILLRAPAGEREPAPVRRPSRLSVAVLTLGEWVGRCGAVGRREPDGAAVAVLLQVDPGDDEGDQPPVGGDLRIGGRDELSDVGGFHGLTVDQRQRQRRPP
jgi:hypothetical protein